MSTPAAEVVVPLGPADVPAVIELCSLALPDEVVSVDDLEAVVPLDGPTAGHQSDEPPLVHRVAVAAMGRRGAHDELVGAAAVSMTDVLGTRSAHLQLLVVHPAHRLRGVARDLVVAAEVWASANGATALTVGAGAPFYLFTGVDSRWTDALSCFEALGYERVDAELDLVCPTVPASTASRGTDAARGVRVDHITDERGASDLGRWVRTHYPHWAAEFTRAAAAGTVVVAADDEGLLGAAAHSVSRFGVIGPVAVAPRSQGRGVGARLMAEVLGDLSVAGLRTAEIAWTSTVRFYARACGARVGRTSLVLRRELSA